MVSQSSGAIDCMLDTLEVPMPAAAYTLIPCLAASGQPISKTSNSFTVLESPKVRAISPAVVTVADHLSPGTSLITIVGTFVNYSTNAVECVYNLPDSILAASTMRSGVVSTRPLFMNSSSIICPLSVIASDATELVAKAIEVGLGVQGTFDDLKTFTTVGSVTVVSDATIRTVYPNIVPSVGNASDHYSRKQFQKFG